MPSTDARLKRWSLISSGLCFGFALILPIAISAALLLGDPLHVYAAEVYGIAAPAPLPAATTTLVWVGALAPAAITSAMLFIAARALGRFSQGDWFHRSAGAAVRAIGLLVAALLVIEFAFDVAIQFALQPDGGSLSIAVSSSGILTALLALTLFLIGDVLTRAAALAEDAAAIV
ncbi:MAG: DUF2975 domain-containing protein [Pseudomonadota bacterium]